MQERELKWKPVLHRLWQWLKDVFYRLRRRPLLLVAVVLVIALSVLWGSIRSGARVSSRMVELGLRNIGHLATQEAYCTNVQVIRDAKQIRGWTIPFTSSQYIFSYDCRITAGMEFDQLDVQMDPLAKRITVLLPETKVLSQGIQSDSLEIYDESRSIFTPLGLDAIGKSYVALEEEAIDKAVGNGLLDTARENAERVLRTFLEGMMGDDWEIVIADKRK